MTPRDILVEGRRRIAQGWCQVSLASAVSCHEQDLNLVDTNDPMATHQRNIGAVAGEQKPVDTNDPRATHWCSIGAICAAAGEPDFWDIRSRKNLPGYEAAKLLEQAVGEPIDPTGEFTALVTWNDAENRTQADVLAAYDRAIAAAP